MYVPTMDCPMPRRIYNQDWIRTSVMNVTTKEPDKYIAVRRNMVDQIKQEGFPADDGE